MPKAKYRPRLVIECSQEQKNTIMTHVEWGMQRKFFEPIVEDITSLLDEFGYEFVMYVMNRRFSYREPFKEYLDATGRLANPTSN